MLNSLQPLRVPLPSAPLSANILESLNSSTQDSGGGGGVNQQLTAPNPPQGAAALLQAPLSSATSAQQLQKVIEAQRTQIALLSQLTQQMVQQAHHNQVVSQPESPQIPGCLSGRTQTFDYGNQSNKALEKVAAEQLEREYFEDRWR